MLVTLMSLVGVIIGASLQYVFTRILDERRHHRDLRTQAFVDYIQCISEIRHRFIQPQAPKERELLARLTEAKARICLYGSGNVVLKLAEFDRLGGIIDSHDQRDAFVHILLAMRGDRDAKQRDLETVLLGVKR
jgi:hypothetical protein